VWATIIGERAKQARHYQGCTNLRFVAQARIKI